MKNIKEAKPNYYIAENIAQMMKVEVESIIGCEAMLCKLDPFCDSKTMAQIVKIVEGKKRALCCLQGILSCYDMIDEPK